MTTSLILLLYIARTKPPWRQGEEKVDYTEDDVARKTNGGQMDWMKFFNNNLIMKKIFENL